MIPSVEPDGPLSGFGRATVHDWLTLLCDVQSPQLRATPEGVAQRTLALAVLRGALIDLLATDEPERTGAAVARAIETTFTHDG